MMARKSNEAPVDMSSVVVIEVVPMTPTTVGEVADVAVVTLVMVERAETSTKTQTSGWKTVLDQRLQMASRSRIPKALTRAAEEVCDTPISSNLRLSGWIPLFCTVHVVVIFDSLLS